MIPELSYEERLQECGLTKCIHEVKLVKDQCRLDIRKHSFSQRTMNKLKA